MRYHAQEAIKEYSLIVCKSSKFTRFAIES